IKMVDTPLVVIEVIELPHLIRAVVRAVTGADTSVIHHQVQPFLIVHRGIDRTDVFARSRFTMLAEHRLRDHLRLVYPFVELLLLFGVETFKASAGVPGPGVITVDPYPMHLASATHLVFADNGDVVLAL